MQYAKLLAHCRETQFMGETRIDAIDAAKWCLTAKPGETRTLPKGTTMEVSET